MPSLCSASTRSRLEMGQALPHVARVGHRGSSSSLSQTTPTQPATHLRGPTRLARLFATVAICSVARRKRSGHPDCPRAGFDTSVAMGCSIFTGPTFHATHPAPHTQPSHPAPHPASTRGVWYTIRGCLNQPRRSRVDLNLTPTESPLMRSLMAHVCWRMAVAAWMSYVSPHIHLPPNLAAQSSVHWPPLTLTPHLLRTGGLEALLQPRAMATTPSFRQQPRCGVHSHRASPR